MYPGLMSQNRLLDRPVSCLYAVRKQKVVYDKEGKASGCDFAFFFQEICRIKDLVQHWFVCEEFQQGQRTT